MTKRLHAPHWKRRLRAAALPALAATLLAACSTTPLPPWEGPAQNAVVVRSQGAITHRLPPGPAVGLGVTGAADYSPAVAARFPDPGVHYATPGLQPGRQAFSSNEEVRAFLQDAANRASAGVQARVQAIGRSQMGAEMHAVFIAKGAALTPENAQSKPTVLFIGQQHGNEPAAGEALLVVAQQLLSGAWSKALEQVNVIIVPHANPDGTAANQRELANRIDLNRDHLLLRTPEARALALLVRDYQPLVVVDNHEYTVGGRFQQKFQGLQAYDGMLQYAMTPNVAEFVTRAAKEWFAQPIFQAWEAQNLRAQWYFTTSADMQDMGLRMGGIRPDTGRNVNGLKNAVSLLIETRGIGIGRTHIQRRVHTHVIAAHKVLEQAAARAGHLKQVQNFVARDAASQACQGRMVIDAAQQPEQREIALLDPRTGVDVMRTLPWQSSLAIRPTLERNRPCGYLLGEMERDAVERLHMLGVTVLRVAEPGSLQVEAYQETARETATRQDVRGAMSAEGEILRIRVQLRPQRVEVPAGAYYVPMGQPLAHLIAAALEPDTQNSYFAHRIQRDLGSLVRVTEQPTALVFEEVD